MFGNGILTPIEEADNVFSLEVSLAFFSLLYRDNINGFFFKGESFKFEQILEDDSQFRITRWLGRSETNA